MLKLTAFIPYEIIIIYTECGARAYGNCKVVRAARVQRLGNQTHNYKMDYFQKCTI